MNILEFLTLPEVQKIYEKWKNGKMSKEEYAKEIKKIQKQKGYGKRT